MLTRIYFVVLFLFPSVLYSQESNLTSLAKWVRYINIKGNGCSGLLFNYQNHDILITAGHCFKTNDDGDTVQFMFLKKFPVMNVVGVLHKHSNSNVDVAIIDLLTDTIRNQRFIIDFSEPFVAIGETAYLFGFPLGLRTEYHSIPGSSGGYFYPIVRSGIIAGANSGRFLTEIILDINSNGQNSGGPIAVVDERTNLLRVIGVNKGSWRERDSLYIDGSWHVYQRNSGLSLSHGIVHLREILSNIDW